jgi:hypothetical protein
MVAAAIAARDAAPDEIRACVQKSSGQTRIIQPGESCRQTESMVVWNSPGPTGATGAQGPTGPGPATGPTGFPPPEPLTPVTFLPGWTNYGDPYEEVRFFKDSSNVVHLQGLALRTAGYGNRSPSTRSSSCPRATGRRRG